MKLISPYSSLLAVFAMILAFCPGNLGGESESLGP